MRVIFTLRSLPVIFFLIFFSATAFSQLHQWTWMTGEDTTNQVPVYGTAGVPAPENTPGGRSHTAHWKDRSGNFWLYGGTTVTAPGVFFITSDFWKYDVSSGLWTSISALGFPPGLQSSAPCWTDNSGNFWLFGSWTSSGLWKYTITTNTWTYIAGSSSGNGVYGNPGVPAPTNIPGIRGSSVTWTDQFNNLWLFGGLGKDVFGATGNLNDLWKYNITTGLWTWMKGDYFVNSRAVYGTKNVASALNTPGSRFSSNGWSDHSGNLWMFGGIGFTTLPLPGQGSLADMWKYSISSNEWVWVNGADSFVCTSAYEVPGVFSPAGHPGGDWGLVTWVDKEDKFWLFGGIGYASAMAEGELNGLWEFDPVINQWTFRKGDPVCWHEGVYGTKAVAAADNRPGARESGAAWTDEQGNLWLYGGGGLPENASSTAQAYYFSDMWKYTLAVAVPVKLVSFSGKLQDNHALLNWIVDNESNLSLYEIERSTDAVEYKKAGTLTAKNLREYNFSDDVSAFTNPVLYYRLKMVDTDGKFSYSKVISFRLKNATFTLSPNPARAYTQIKFSKALSENVYIEITDESGKKIIKDNYESSGTAIIIPTDKLPAGTYRVTIIYQGEKAVQSLMIAR